MIFGKTKHRAGINTLHDDGHNYCHSTPSPIPLLPNSEKKVIISLRCGVIRCVGASTTCAGTKERQLLSTAVVLFSIWIIPYMYAHIN